MRNFENSICKFAFLKIPLPDIFNNLIGNNEQKFRQNYKLLHIVPRTICLEASSRIGKQKTLLSEPNQIEIVELSVSDHKAIDLVEKLIQSIKRKLSCIKVAANYKFNIKNSFNFIINQL